MATLNSSAKTTFQTFHAVVTKRTARRSAGPYLHHKACCCWLCCSFCCSGDEVCLSQVCQCHYNTGLCDLEALTGSSQRICATTAATGAPTMSDISPIEYRLILSSPPTAIAGRLIAISLLYLLSRTLCLWPDMPSAGALGTLLV